MNGKGSIAWLVIVLCLGGFVRGFGQVGSDSTDVVIHVKFNTGKEIKVGRLSSPNRFDIAAVDQVTQLHGVVSVRRIFPDAGKYEAAHQAFGLHLWYEIRFPRSGDIRGILRDLRTLAHFEKVEQCQSYSLIGSDSYASPSALPAGTNDPWFSQQWNLNNTGQLGGRPGADIKMLDAWTIESGRSDVIVAVIDGGVDIIHPELSNAMWVNADEIPNNHIDDDNNGYTDDYNGYGFGDNTPVINSHPHGTHVAGTIGAVSNNGNGMAGIAGGSGNGNGVRIMSLATFGTYQNGGFEAAMVYAADNGAVISQNSWGGGSTAIEAAINYFIERAGLDNTSANFNSKLQIGPMAGGVVVFAAGNDGGAVSYPASYPPVIAVAATDRSDFKASFSNFGPQIDISAPGVNILSTVPSRYGSYSFASGTSMACPHVSGVAALIVSKEGGPGLVPAYVQTRLVTSADPLEPLNPVYANKLGAGRLNAFKALEPNDFIPPAPVNDLAATLVQHDSLVLQWTATGSSGNTGRAYSFDLRYSSNPITADNFYLALPAPNLPKPPSSGSVVTYAFPNPVIHQAYYFAIRSSDVFLNASTISNIISVVIPGPPKLLVEPTDVSVSISAGDTTTKWIRITNTGEGILRVKSSVGGFAGIPGPGPKARDPLTKGKLYAIHTLKTRIDQLNTQTGEVIRSIPLPEPASGFTDGLAYDGQYLYFAHGTNRKIYKIDARDGTVLRSMIINTIGNIDGLGFSGNFLYVHVSNSSELLEIDFETSTVKRSIPIPYTSNTSSLSFAGQRGTILMSDGPYINEINPTTGQLISSIAGSSNGYTGLAYSEADQVLYAHHDGVMTVFDIPSKSVIRSFNCQYTSGLASDESQFDWVNMDGKTFSIVAGESAEVPVRVNTIGLNSGAYSAVLRLISNDPVTPTILLPLAATVSGEPTILSTSSTVDFKTLYVGYPVDSLVIIRNTGLTPLVVNQIESSRSDIELTHSISTLAPGAFGQLVIRANPSAPGTVAGTVTVHSNDPDNGAMQLTIRGEILTPPVMEVSPMTIAVTLPAGGSAERDIVINNPGGSSLTWVSSIGISTTGASAGGRSQESTAPKLQAIGDYSTLASSPEPLCAIAVVPETGLIYGKSATTNAFFRYNLLTNSWQTLAPAPIAGGIRAFYMYDKIYIWHSTTYTVYNIAANSWSTSTVNTGTTAVTSDGTYFYFARSNLFYRHNPDSGTFKTMPSVFTPISSDGGSLAYANGVIYAKNRNQQGNGNTRFMRYFIQAGAWEDAPEMPGEGGMGNAFDTGSQQYYTVSATGFKIFDVKTETWSDKAIPLFTISDAVTFAGLEGKSGVYFSESGGTRFGRYETPPSPPWLSLNQMDGIISPGATTNIRAQLSAYPLLAGEYHGSVTIMSTHPPIQKKVDVTLTVEGGPDIELNRLSAPFGPVYVGKTYAFQFQIRNKGTAPLVVSSIISSHPEYSFTTDSFMIYPGQVKLGWILFQPTSTGQKSGIITLVTNDSDEGTVELSATGEGILPPEIEINVDSIKTTLYSGATSDHSVTVRNTGGSQLELAAEAQYGSIGWIKTTPSSKLLEPGESCNVDVQVMAGSRPAGKNVGAVEFTHRGDYSSWVPVVLTVIPAPQFTLSSSLVEFGERFSGFSYDSTLEIRNTGLQPLQITSATTSHPEITILQDLPVVINPGNTSNITVRFNPSGPGAVNSVIDFYSNDPDQSIVSLSVTATVVTPPVAAINFNSISKTVAMGADSTVNLRLDNISGTNLRWQARSNVLGEPGEGYGVVDRPSTPGPASFLANDDEWLYVQIRNTSSIYRRYLSDPSWQLFVNTAPQSSTGASGVFINHKLYISYLDNDSTIAVLNVATKTWSYIPNELAAGTAMMATDGSSLFAGGGGAFKKYDPITSQWTTLALPDFVFTGYGGMSYLSGKIYAHEGNGFTEFSRYDVATNQWETLRSIPEGAVIGSAIDPYRKRYYTYGSHGGKNLYEYDIKSNLWNVWPVSVPLDDGGLTFSATQFNRGLYFLQGATGNKHYWYGANDSLNWIRLNSFGGELPAPGSQYIGVNLSSGNKVEGTYHGKVSLQSNDPNFSSLDIPVTMTIKYMGPRIGTDVNTVDFLTIESGTTNTALTVRNTGLSDLNWQAVQDFPSWMNVSPGSGSVPPDGTQTVQISFNSTGLFPSSTPHTHTLRIQSNDRFKSTLQMPVRYTYRGNTAPVLNSSYPDITLKTEDPPKQLNLSGKFFDSENDPFHLKVSASDSTIVNMAWIDDHTLEVKPLVAGTTFITVRAIDIYDAQRATSFKIIVKDLVSGIEPSGGFAIQASPNPFQRTLAIHLEAISGNLSLMMYDLTGKPVRRQEATVKAGAYETVIDGDSLASGIYFVRVLIDGQLLGTVRVIKR